MLRNFTRIARWSSTTVCLLVVLSKPLHAQNNKQSINLTIEPQTAGISGFRSFWNTPLILNEQGAVKEVEHTNAGTGLSAVWSTSQPGALAFDAVHRSLLVRFPGAANKIATQLAKGYQVEKAELVLPFRDTEMWAENYSLPPGMYFLGDKWSKIKPQWHAVAWALRKPWTADAKLGTYF